MKPKKLALKKVTVSNLSEDLAKRIYGGEAPTYDNDPNNPTGCTDKKASCGDSPLGCTNPLDCQSNVCPSGPGQPQCTNPPNGCQGTIQPCASNETPCFTQAECTYTACTSMEEGCQFTYQDKSICRDGGDCDDEG